MKYIGTKLVEAVPAIRITAAGEVLIHEEDTDWSRAAANLAAEIGARKETGYKVIYPDGYVSWCPKEVFERANLPLMVNQELRTDAPSISQEMVDGFIAGWETKTMGGKTTVVKAALLNGFEIVESSACVSAENYDEKMGEQICLEKIKDKIWLLLGFLLQTAVHGVGGPVERGEVAGEADPDAYMRREV